MPTKLIRLDHNQSEQGVRFQASLLDQMRSAVIATDLEGKIVLWNEFAKRLYHWTANEVLGKSILDVAVPDLDRDKVNAIRAHTQQHGYWEGECRVKRKDGSTFLAHVTDAVIKDQQGKSIGGVCVSEEISHGEQAKAESHSREEILQTIFDRVPVLIALFDERGRLSFVNRWYEHATGWSLEEVRSRIMNPELHLDQDETQQVLEFVLNPPKDWASFRLRTKGGSWIDTAWTSMPLRDGTLIGIGMDLTASNRAVAERRTLDQELFASKELLDVLSRRLIEAQEEERRNLSRELHDEIGQVLTTVNLNLEGLRSKIDPSAMERLEDSLKVVNIAIEQVRNMSLNLRPASLDLLGLDATLRVYLTRQSIRAGLAVAFTSELEGERFPAPVETVCFRVVQEALTNVFRHARAAHCWIELARNGGQIHLSIRDDGQGFDPVVAKERSLAGGGFGLLGMFERVQLAGGEMNIDSAPGRGTTIRASFPLPAPTAEQETS